MVRKAFHLEVLKLEHDKADTFVIDELGLRNGEIRADIAVVNGKMIGYEIKTERDTLNRLRNQILAYNEVFNRIYIVTAHNHLAKVLDAVPAWWGIYIIGISDSSAFSFDLYRKAQLNKRLKCLGLAKLLWKDEVLEILNDKMKFNLKSSVSKEELYEILSGTCPSNRLSKLVINYLKTRPRWRKDPVVLL